MEICIIGGGVSGIITAKIALSYNLVPFILNKSSKIGGLWNSDSPDSGVWDSLSLNGSKHVVAFSDQLWEESDKDFPEAVKYTEYIQKYTIKHNLIKYFNNNSTVTSVQQLPKGYTVSWQKTGENFEKFFWFVVIANGKLNKPYNTIPNLSTFKGLHLFSGQYRSNKALANKKVVCIGKGVSGSDIALDATKATRSVTQIWRRKTIMIPKLINSQPYDYIFNSFSNLENFRHYINFPDVICYNQEKMLALAGNPGDINSSWKINEDDLKQGQIGQHSYSPEYKAAVKEGLIKFKQGEVRSFVENGVLLDNGEVLEADVVVDCTGYTVDLSFLSQDIKRKIKYNERNKMLPFVSYLRILHPELPGLGFAGFVFGAGGRYELQAEVLIRYFVGMLGISDLELWNGVNVEIWMRENMRGWYEAYNPFGYTKECLRILRSFPNVSWLKGAAMYKNGPIVPYFFFMDREGQREVCEGFINEMRKKLPKI